LDERKDMHLLMEQMEEDPRGTGFPKFTQKDWRLFISSAEEAM